MSADMVVTYENGFNGECILKGRNGEMLLSICPQTQWVMGNFGLVDRICNSPDRIDGIERRVEDMITTINHTASEIGIAIDSVDSMNRRITDLETENAKLSGMLAELVSILKKDQSGNSDEARKRLSQFLFDMN